jgi:hypothetical protein
MEFKKFRSPGIEEIRIADLSGHAATLSPEYTSIPSILWGQAYAAGAISEDMQVNDMDSFISQKKREAEELVLKEREEVKAALRQIVKEPQGFLDKEGKPLTRKVIGLMEKPVKKDLVDSVWEELIKEEGI